MAFHLIDIAKDPILKPKQDAILITLDGRRCNTKKSLLKEIGVLLHFPEYYGHNFDALAECLEGIENSEMYWFITHPSFICCDEKSALHLDTFYQVIQNTLIHYATSKQQLSIIASNDFLIKIRPVYFE
jgi:hypothetical protein